MALRTDTGTAWGVNLNGVKNTENRFIRAPHELKLGCNMRVEILPSYFPGQKSHVERVKATECMASNEITWRKASGSIDGSHAG